jgi:DNA-binding NarL/FixJ family response regulator
MGDNAALGPARVRAREPGGVPLWSECGDAAIPLPLDLGFLMGAFPTRASLAGKIDTSVRLRRHSMPATRIIIVDDHPLFRGALNQALAAAFDEAEIIEAASLDELMQKLVADGSVDLVLLDLSMPGVQGLSGLLLLRAQHPSVPVVIVSANDEPATIRRAIGFGALGFVPKSQPVEQIRAAVRNVLDGEVWVPAGIDLGAPEEETSLLAARLSTLTPQQVRVLMMLGEGLLNKQIAYRLGVSEATIKAHVSAILHKLGVDSRTQAVIAINKLESGDWPKAEG